MSNTGLIIEERSRDIGDFIVGRLLPFRKKRMVGPFIFIDHMGPMQIYPGHYLDVGQHPHIGLSTLTYLFEGEIMHRDSTGAIQRVIPHSVGWMTAGKGVVHTERTPADWRTGGHYPIHGFQIWVALPQMLEDIDPSFFFSPPETLPRWRDYQLELSLIAGQGFGRQSPVPVHSDLFLIEVKAEERTHLQLNGQVKGEIGICVVSGYIEACEERIEKGNTLVSKEEDICSITVGEHTHLLLFGGIPFPEKRFIDWNFVSTDREKIKAARQAWTEKQFEMVPNETGYVPLPNW